MYIGCICAILNYDKDQRVDFIRQLSRIDELRVTCVAGSIPGDDHVVAPRYSSREHRIPCKRETDGHHLL